MMFDTYTKRDNDVWAEKKQSIWTVTAEGYDEWIASDFQDQYEVNWNVLTRYIYPTLRILDVGCGPGALSVRVAQQCHEVWGVDMTPEMIRLAEKKAAVESANIYFQQADACELPFENYSFDTVMSINALQTMNQPGAALMEMSRVLKPGGELLLITYCYGDSSLSDTKSLIDWVVKFGAQAVWHSFTLTQLEGLLQANGFEVVEAERIWEEPVVAFLRGRSTTF